MDLYTYIPQLVRQISEPSTISFEDFTPKVAMCPFSTAMSALWAKGFGDFSRNLQVSSVDWVSLLLVALVIHFRFLVLWFVCRGLCLKTTTSDFNHSICNIPLWCLWYFILAHQWNASWKHHPKNKGKPTFLTFFRPLPKKGTPKKIRGIFRPLNQTPRSKAVPKICIKRKRPLRLGEHVGNKNSNVKQTTRRKNAQKKNSFDKNGNRGIFFQIHLKGWNSILKFCSTFFLMFSLIWRKFFFFFLNSLVESQWDVNNCCCLVQNVVFLVVPTTTCMMWHRWREHFPGRMLVGILKVQW